MSLTRRGIDQQYKKELDHLKISVSCLRLYASDVHSHSLYRFSKQTYLVMPVTFYI